MQPPGKPRGPSGQICPLRNIDCGDENGCQACYFWTHLEGTNPITGEKISGYDCIEHWKVMIGLHQVRLTSNGLGGIQAATESLRNEVARQRNIELPTVEITSPPRRISRS